MGFSTIFGASIIEREPLEELRGGFAFDGAILNRYGTGNEAHNLGFGGKYVGYCFG